MAVEEKKEANVVGEEVAPEEEAPVESLPSYDPKADLNSDICQTGEALEELGPEEL